MWSRSSLSGAVAGVATGLIDGLWSYDALGQYLPSVGAKLGLLLHLALSYAFAGALLGAILGLLAHLLARSPAPALLSALSCGQSEIPFPRLSVVPLAFATLVITMPIAYRVAHQSLVFRKHLGLLVASAILIALVFCAVAILVFLLLLGPMSRGLERLRGWQRALGAILIAIVSLLVAYALRPSEATGLPLAAFALLGVLSVAALLPMLLALFDRGRKRVLALPLVVCAFPLLAASLGATFFVISQGDAPPALRIANAMSLTLLALLASLILSVFLARILEAPLRSLARRRAPWTAALLMLVLAVGVGGLMSQRTLALLSLRPYVVATVLFVLGLAAYRGLHTLAARIPAWSVPAALPLLFLGILLSGGSESVQKAQTLHTGLGQPLARVYRQLGDWDRDGASRWLGGGDCDDSNPRVHPGADEIPFDGIDNNCLRGDVTQRSLGATHFAKLPKSLPPDFNVLFLTIDTIRADHLGAYGYAKNTTPNIDALAKDGTLFLNGWAHAPSTRYSIPAMLTGRYPLNVRYLPIPGQWPGLSLENTTIAEIMQERGLTTGAILNYWYFDTRRNMNQGFAHYDNSNKRLHKAVGGEGPSKTSGSSSKEQSDKAIEYITKHASERFFLWTHYYDPHYDYEKHPGTPTFGNNKIGAYDHEIAFTDHHIGRVIDELKARGLYEKTIIVITGDHGEGFGEHGIDLHGYHLYAAQTKVPLIIRIPGTTPSVVTMPASHVDVLPTLANLTGAPSTDEMLGRSLLGVITGEEDKDQERYVFQQLSYENNNEYRGAASSKCHVLYNISPNRSWELYRVDRDPGESTDIINNPGECANARLALETWHDYSQIPEGAIEALLSEVPPPGSLKVDFGKAISLLELSIPKKIRQGQNVPMQLTWAAKGRPQKGWKVFMHFETQAKAPRAARFTADHKPTRPFSWWSKDQHIRYDHAVNVPRHQALGHYDLWFGIYKGSARMQVHGSDMEIVDRRVKLMSIEVIP